MTGRIWDAFLTASDRAHMDAAEPRQRFGFGARPAVLSIDNYRAAVGDEPLPLLESIQRWPSSTGMTGWKALERIAVLFDEARRAGVPVVHVTGLAEADSGIPGWGRPRSSDRAADPERERRRFEIVEQAAPLPGEVVVRKTAPSAFFGTALMAHLHGLGVDTLVVCGESTSGCVRASVIEARSYRFRVIVAEDCVYDRHEATHAINLFDMDQKYADVLPLDQVVERFRPSATDTAAASS